MTYNDHAIEVTDYMGETRYTVYGDDGEIISSYDSRDAAKDCVDELEGDQ